MKPVQQRFWKRAKRSTERSYGGSPCWEWQEAINYKSYGQFRFNGRTIRANRVAWVLTFGAIPDGLHVLHHCDNPLCINPKHLFLGTNQQNVDDRVAKGRNGRKKRI